MLPRAIGSVLAQSHERLELIVVDDASGDDTLEVLAAIDDPACARCAWTRRPAARARVTPRSTRPEGEVIAYLDDDNEMDPAWLRTVAWAFEHHEQAEVAYGALILDDGRLPRLYHPRWDRDDIDHGNPVDQNALRAPGGAAWRTTTSAALRVRLGHRAPADARGDPLRLPAVAARYQLTGERLARRRRRGARSTSSRAICARDGRCALRRRASAAPASSAKHSSFPSRPGRRRAGRAAHRPARRRGALRWRGGRPAVVVGEAQVGRPVASRRSDGVLLIRRESRAGRRRADIAARAPGPRRGAGRSRRLEAQRAAGRSRVARRDRADDAAAQLRQEPRQLVDSACTDSRRPRCRMRGSARPTGLWAVHAASSSASCCGSSEPGRR